MPEKTIEDLSSGDLPETELNRLLVDFMPLGMFTANSSGKITFQNRIFSNLFGGPLINVFEDNAIREAGLDIVFKETITNGLGTTFMGPYKQYTINVLTTPIISPKNGTVIGLMGLITDHTTQVKNRLKLEEIVKERTAELGKRTQELVRSEHRFRNLIEVMETGLWIADQKEQTTYINPRIEEMLGYSKEEIIGKSVLEFIVPEDHKKLEDIDRERYVSKIPTSVYDLTLIKKDSSLIHALVYGVGLYDEKGECVETFATITDISDRKKAEQEREALLERLQDLESSRRVFLTTISHETRTPITVILGQVDLLLKGKRGDLTEKTYSSLESIQRNIHRLERLLGDTQALLRIESNAYELNLQDFNLIQIIKNTAQDFHHLLQQRDQKFELDPVILHRESLIVNGDPEKIIQVLNNLVENAILYSPIESQIRIQVTEEEKNIIISVLDNGYGIPGIQQQDPLEKRIDFDAIKIDKGLGLTIVKQIIDRHNGEVWFETGIDNKGTCVSFSLPKKKK